MDVRRLTREATDEEIAAWRACMHEAWMADRPWEIVPPQSHYAQLLRVGFPDEVTELYAAYDGEHMVGVLEVAVTSGSNKDKVEARVAVVLDHRRRGIGRELMELAEQRAREADGTYLLTITSYPFEERETNGNRRFAEAIGMALDLDEIHRMCPLPVDEAVLDELEAKAWPQAEGYRIETYDTPVPERYRTSYFDVENQLPLDAPMGAVPWAKSTGGEEMHLAIFDFLRETGRVGYTGVAISPEDEVVAYTTLATRADEVGVSQWGTLVRRDHRGHKLGTLVKIANLRRLQTEHPERRELHTTNAEVNEHMIGINEALGFRPVAVHPSFYKRLDR
jgi:GNAT superfamily N-acetyltransferase